MASRVAGLGEWNVVVPGMEPSIEPSATAAIQRLVAEAEARVPGGLDGGPGEISPSAVYVHVGELLSRTLTKAEKEWAKTTLTRLVMQVEPPSRIRTSLFLGNFYNATDVPVLRERGITRIVNMCAEANLQPPSDVYAAEGLTCACFPLRDSPDEDILPLLSKAVQYLQRAEDECGAALVHCEYGARPLSCLPS